MHRRTRERRIPRDALLVDGGTVRCPDRNADVSIERCFTCGAFTELREDPEQGKTFVRCRPVSRQFLPVGI